MQTNLKRAGSWLAVLAFAGVAFAAGQGLRNHASVYVPSRSTSIQANALLKFTPECMPVTATKWNGGATENKELLLNVVKLLKSYYVEPITSERETGLARGAVRGMLESLADPDSHFVDPSERKLIDDAGAGTFYGMGAVLAIKKEKIGDMDTAKVVVVAPMPGSPAEKAGLRPGDSITYIGGKWIITENPFEEAQIEKITKAIRNREAKPDDYQKTFDSAAKKLADGMKISDALEQLTSKTSGETTITVDRAGRSKPMEFKIKFGTVSVAPMEAKMLKDGILCIRVSQFNAHAANEFSREIDSVLKSSNKPKALVIDLRNDPGGLMDSAAKIAGRIDGGGQQAVLQEKNHRRIITTRPAQRLNIPVAVLVNGGTASVAELVAATLKENSSATLIGTKTFGDGMAQTPMILKDGSAAVLTTGKMLSAHGNDFDGKGLTPDRVVEQDQQSGDAQLAAAERLLLTKLGRV